MAVGLVAACSQGTSPSTAGGATPGDGDSIPLGIVNTSDVPLRIGSYLNWDPPLPQLLGGLELGWASPGTSCLLLPRVIRVTVENVVTHHVDTLVWTAASTLALTVVDTANGGDQIGVTTAFVPDSSPGWKVTIPGQNQPVTPAPPCTR